MYFHGLFHIGKTISQEVQIQLVLDVSISVVQTTFNQKEKKENQWIKKCDFFQFKIEKCNSSVFIIYSKDHILCSRVEKKWIWNL